MPQDYTPFLKKKKTWDDKDLVQISSYKGVGKGDAGGVTAAEYTTYGELKAEILAAVPPAGADYTSYVALLASNATNLTPTILHNDLGFVPTPTRLNVGQYHLSHPGGFPQGKTWVSITGESGGAGQVYLAYNDGTDDDVWVEWTGGDFGMSGVTSIEIRVYP